MELALAGLKVSASEGPMKSKHKMKFLLLAFLLLSACESPSETIGAIENQKRETMVWQQCLDLGGVPIRSIWDNRLKRCDFPPGANP